MWNTEKITQSMEEHSMEVRYIMNMVTYIITILTG